MAFKFPTTPEESFAFQKWHFDTMPAVPKSLSFAQHDGTRRDMTRSDTPRHDKIVPSNPTKCDNIETNKLQGEIKQIPRNGNRIEIVV